MINVTFIDKHPLICEGLSSLLSDVEDVEVLGCNSGFDEFFRFLIKNKVHVVIIVHHNLDPTDIDYIRKLSQRYPNIKVLSITLYNNEKFILKLIKAGAKGHLVGDATKSELLEAIYSLRSGYEFYTKTITDFLLSNYLNDKDSMNEIEKEHRKKNISPREMEVLKLFAEGLTNREIADKLFISVRTVETHKNNIMRKINLRTTVDLVKFAIKNNIIELE